MSKLNILYESIIDGLLHMLNININKYNESKELETKTIEILNNSNKVYELCFEFANSAIERSGMKLLNLRKTGKTEKTKDNTTTMDNINLTSEVIETNNEQIANEKQCLQISELKKEIELLAEINKKQNKELNTLRDSKECVTDFINSNLKIITVEYKHEIETLSTSIDLMREFYEDELIKRCEQIESLTLNIDNMLIK